MWKPTSKISYIQKISFDRYNDDKYIRMYVFVSSINCQDKYYQEKIFMKSPLKTTLVKHYVWTRKLV